MAKKQSISYQDIEASLAVFKTERVAAPEVGYMIWKSCQWY